MAQIAGFGTNVTTSSTVTGGTSLLGRDFIDLAYPVTQNANLTDVDILLSSFTAPTSLKIKVWRSNGDNYDLIGTSQEFNSLTPSTINSLTLSTPIPVLVGDFIGIHADSDTSNNGVSIVREIISGSTANNTSFANNTDFAASQPKTAFGTRLSDGSSLAFSANSSDGGLDTITVEEAPKNNHVYQRGSSNSKTVSFNVVYGGSPSSLEYRLLDASDNITEITSWVVFDSSPSGSSSNLTFSAPASTTGYHVQVRFGNDNSITDTQSFDWYVGANVLIAGQSLAEQLNSDSGVTPPAGYFVYSGTASSPPTTGVGANEIASIIINTENVAVAITNAALSGSALSSASGDTNYWDDATGSLWVNAINLVNGLTNGENELEFVWWHQGTRDSLGGVSESQYLAALTSFFNRVRTTFSGRDGNLKILSAIIARDTRGAATDSSHQAIRDAQLSYYASDSDTYPVTAYPLQTYDGVHGNAAGYTWLAGQIVSIYYDSIGLVSSSAPSILSASIGDAANKIDLNFDSNLLLTDSAYSTEGVRVTLDGTPATVTDFSRKSATAATITLSSNATGDVLVWLGYGVGYTQAQLTYPRSENVTLPNTGGTYNVTATTFSEQSVTVSSGITLNIGAPDGTYHLYLAQGNQGNVTTVYDGPATFSGGSATISGLTVASGTLLRGFVDSSNTPALDTGDGVKGVTV